MKNKITWTKTTIEEFEKLFNDNETTLEKGLYIVKYETKFCHYVTFQVKENHKLYDCSNLCFNSSIVAYAKLD